MYFKSMYKGDRVCVNCRYFYQHYVRIGMGFPTD